MWQRNDYIGQDGTFMASRPRCASALGLGVQLGRDKLYDAVPMSSSSCLLRASCPPGLGAQVGELRAQTAEMA